MPAFANEISAEKKQPERRRALGLIFLTVFMDILGFSIIIPIYPKLLAHYLDTENGSCALLETLVNVAGRLAGGTHDSFVTAVLFGGLLGSFYSLLQFLFAPVWGKLSDRHGRRPVLLLTLAGTAAAYLLWIFAGAFWVLVAARMLAGIMAGNISVATAAAADLTTGKERAGGMAVVGVAFALGFLVGPALGGFSSLWEWVPAGSAQTSGFALNPFSFPAFVAFVLAGANWFFAKKFFRETRPAEIRAGESGGERASIFRFGRVTSPGIKRAVLTNLIFTAVFSGMETTLVFMTTALFGYTPRENAGVFMFSGIFLILAQGVVVRRFAPEIGERKIVLCGLGSGIAAFLLIAATHGAGTDSKILFYAGMVFFAFSIGLIQPGLSSLVSLYSSAGEQGKNLGIFRSAGALARVIGPICAAFIYFKTHNHAWVYLTGAALSALPAAFAAALPKPNYSEKNDNR